MRTEYEKLLTLKTPCYVTLEERLIENLEVLRDVQASSGCKILLAQKAFSQYKLYGVIADYLSGTCSSGLYEARLAFETMPPIEGKVEHHVFSPAYKEEEFREIIGYCGHIVFNSFSQWEKFGGAAIMGNCICGIRVNPEISTQSHTIYDPCSMYSRLGVRISDFPKDLPEGLTGLQYHTLCEQNFDALETTLRVFIAKFGKFFPRLNWVNFGGGHHITRKDYNRTELKKTLREFSEKYNLQVYLEPGEAIALNAGVLVSTVLETVKNRITTAILDTSAACHMPDVIEMPYTPNAVLFHNGNFYDGVVIKSEKDVSEKTVRLAGNTCLAGDRIGDYEFETAVSIGDKIIFGDMAIYTTVKNNTFNGTPLPAVVVLRKNGETETLNSFGYEDFKRRL